MTSKTAV